MHHSQEGYGKATSYPHSGNYHVPASRLDISSDGISTTAADYARQLQWLADVRYPQAKKIRLVQDNLNTHRLANLYLVFPPEEARRLAQRFEVITRPRMPVGSTW